MTGVQTCALPISTKDPQLEKDGKSQKFSGLTEDIFTDHALEFIRSNRSRPFALSLHYRAPHTAYLPVSEDDAAHLRDKKLTLPNYPDLDEKKVENNMRAYLSSIACVDRNVGRVLSVLDKLELTHNTLVIFTSDHGYNLGHHGIWHKGNAIWMLTRTPEKTWPNIQPNQRPNMFDTSLKLPTIVRWPGVVKPGSTIDRTVTNLDWFPTLCEIGQAKIHPTIIVRGRSIASLLKAEELNWDDSFHGEYNMRNGSKTAMRCYRTRDWKLMIDFANPGRGELYNLKNDPDETHDLFTSNQEAAKKARTEIGRAHV